MPITFRLVFSAVRSIAVSPSAATGGMKVARSPGMNAEIIVEPMPMMRPVITACNVSGGRPAGRLNEPDNACFKPYDRPQPRRMPTAEPTRPTTTASTITDPRIWRRPAPTARRSASSRVRWATTIEKVL